MNSVVTSFKVRELFPLGKGGMGTTYLGCAKGAGGFERLIAIKRLHDHLQEDAEACTRLLSEAELAGCVHHANVVAVQHVDRDARGAFLVLDYVEGGSMKELLRLAAPEIVPQPVALRLVLDCLAGLAAIHTATDHRGRSLQILHRDISPENILVGLDGMARLTDFGIARSRARPALTAPSQLVGKLGFMAPEYIDRGNLGPPLDIYSLGVTLWMLLTGKSPWRGLEEAQLLALLLTQGVPELPPEPRISSELRKIVSKACAMKPEDRYSTARDMALAIERSGAPVSEHFEVAAYVGKKFEYSTSERRLEAAQLLTIESNPPPPRAVEDREGYEAVPRTFPVLRAPAVTPPLSDPGESATPAALSVGSTEQAPWEAEGMATQVMARTLGSATGGELHVPADDTASTVRLELTPVGSVRSSDPGGGDLLTHEIPPRTQSRQPGGRAFTGIIAAALFLSAGLFALTLVLQVGAPSQGAAPPATTAEDLSGEIQSLTAPRGAPLLGASPAEVASKAREVTQDRSDSPGRTTRSLAKEVAPPTGTAQKVEAKDSVAGEMEKERPALDELEKPVDEEAVTRPSQPADRSPAPGEIVSRNPYLK